MKRYKRAILFILVFAFIALGAQAADTEAPIITGTEDGSSKNSPLISGTTNNGTFVHIYVDGIYNGKTDAVYDDSGIAQFIYEPFLSINSGYHMVWAVSEDENGNRSKLSNIFKFTIEPGISAPTLFAPATNRNNVSRPFIIGVAKNDLKIAVYIDNELDGEFAVENHESGSASFSYQTAKVLSRGQHSVYTIATDGQNEESQKSNVINFNVIAPSISKSVDEEDAKDEEDEEDNFEADLDQLIKDGIDEEIQEDENGDRGISKSAVIFVLFLAGIAAWIAWVNRELIKEKTKQKKD